MLRFELSGLRTPVYRAISGVYRGIGSFAWPRHGLRVLMYHAIGTPVAGDTRCMYSISPGLFEAHMRFMADRYAGCLVPLSSEIPREGKLRIAVSFDDGYRDSLTVAAPLLSKLGIPFTVFVSTGSVKRHESGFLESADIHALAEFAGASVGSHCVDHIRLTECDNVRLKYELSGSKAYLEDLLGKRVNSVSYPHGAMNSQVRSAAKGAGYEIGASSVFGINRPDRDPMMLYRTDIWADDNLEVFDQKLVGAWDWLRWRTAGREKA